MKKKTIKKKKYYIDENKIIYNILSDGGIGARIGKYKHKKIVYI